MTASEDEDSDDDNFEDIPSPITIPLDDSL